MSILTDPEAAVTTFRVQLSDGGPAFACTPGDTLLRAALRGGVGLPYECNSGGCGSCRFQLQDGDIEDLWPTAPGLPARSRERGFRLACQSRPTSDCTIKVRAHLRPGLAPLPRRRRAELLSRLDLTADMAEFTFRAEDAAEFVAGQFALLSLPGVTGDRAYSMSNLPNADGLWSFVVKRMPNGSGSTTLFDRLAPGSAVMLDGPYGLAYFRDDSPRNLICIAGGSGLSPVLSILGAAVRGEHRERRLRLYYGGRRPADLCVPAVIERDAAMRGRVECITAISDPSITEGWNGERGFIHEIVRRQLEAEGDPAANDYYFCGPPAMTDAVQRLLLDLQIPTSQTFYDRFV